MFSYQHGIKLAGTSLWLDARRVVDDACVSHGHSDHIKRHRHIYATPATASFVRRRLGNIQITEVPFFQPFSIGDIKLKFIPAGHILGSAQILVENNGTRLLYSGDFNTVPNATAEPLAVETCDILIMESTFGNPQYRFPSRDKMIDQLCGFVQSCLQSGEIPLVFGYTLGKAQEAMKILADNGFRLCVHSSVLHLAEIYQQHGIDFGDVIKFNAHVDLEGRVIVLPPQARQSRAVERLQPNRSVFLSGWGIDQKARFRYGVDEVIPLSDHADFDGLLAYIEQTAPKTIYTTHGPRDYYLFLRGLGYDAHPLEIASQTELF